VTRNADFAAEFNGQNRAATLSHVFYVSNTTIARRIIASSSDAADAVGG